MSEPSRGPQPPESFSKATVDRWQVYGGVAGVVALGLTLVNAIKDVIPLSFAASIVVAIVGIVLLYRWGSKSDQRTLRTFLIPVLVTVVGAATAGVTGGLSLQKTIGAVSMGKDLPVDSSTNRSSQTSSTSVPKGASSSSTSSPVSTSSSAGSSNVPAAASSEILRQERITIHRGLYLDLDSLAKDKGIQQASTPGADLDFYSSTLLIAGMKNSVAFASDGFSYDDCVATTARADYISLEKTAEGAKFCLRTTEDRWALLTVAERRVSEKPENDEIDFDVLVWAQR